MTATEHALELTQAAAQAAADKLGTDIVAFDVSEQLAITDVFLVITAVLVMKGLAMLKQGKLAFPETMNELRNDRDALL